MNLRLIINGHGSMEPIYSNTFIATLGDAEKEAGVFLGTECDITVFDQDTDKTVKVLQSERTYKIMHEYDIGDQSVYVSAYYDLIDPAIYLQFKAEELSGDDSTELSNQAVADALISLFGATPAKKCDDAQPIDMHFDRESRCSEWYSNEYTSESLARPHDKLVEVLSPHFREE